MKLEPPGAVPARDESEAPPIDQRPFTLKEELWLALMPTAVVVLLLIAIEAVAEQRILFASLASSAFLIYVDPGHAINRVRTVVLAHGIAASIGVGVDLIMGTGYAPAAVSMVLTIFITLALRAVHPPAISTALTFAFRPGDADKWVIFMGALVVIAVLVVIQQVSVRLLMRMVKRRRLHHSAAG